MNGLILVDKEAGYTSFDAVAVVRRIFETRKAGHGGTLDPNATGLLPVFLGNACALSSLISGGDKVYEAEILLGRSTDTDDIWGETLKELEVQCTEEEAREAVLSFIGTYEQLPPMYSARKSNGKKLYEYARKGIEIERTPVPVRIDAIDILSTSLPYLRFRVRCEKGTYIRSLCRDIGERLGLPACMSALRRTQHGSFNVSDACTVGALKEAKERGELERLLIPVDRVLSIYPALKTKETADRLLLNGNRLIYADLDADSIPEAPEGRVRLYDSAGQFRALYHIDNGKDGLSPVKMFLNGDHQGQ